MLKTLAILALTATPAGAMTEQQAVAACATAMGDPGATLVMGSKDDGVNWSLLMMPLDRSGTKLCRTKDGQAHVFK